MISRIHPTDLLPNTCYPVNIFTSPISKLITCPIGNGALNNPIVASDGHTYCEVCIKTRINNGSNKCSTSNSTFSIEKARPNLMAKSMVDGLDSLCYHHDKGCKWTGKLSLLSSHLQERCQEVRLKCLWEGCEKWVTKRENYKHFINCPYMLEICKNCRKRIAIVEKEVLLIKSLINN